VPVHLLRGIPFFLVTSTIAVAIFIAFVGFAFIQHEHTILAGGILYILQYLPVATCPLSPCYVCLLETEDFPDAEAAGKANAV
jgi:hypothetical protein